VRRTIIQGQASAALSFCSEHTAVFHRVWNTRVNGLSGQCAVQQTGCGTALSRQLRQTRLIYFGVAASSCQLMTVTTLQESFVFASVQNLLKSSSSNPLNAPRCRASRA